MYRWPNDFNSGKIIVAVPWPRSSDMPLRTIPCSKFHNPRAVATTPIPCGSAIVYFFYPTATQSNTKLVIGVSVDLPEVRPRFDKGTKHVRTASLSPTGARAVFNCRGEIITVPAEKGDPRNCTQSPGIHERYPTWSPDGKSIAYFSDASGEYALCVAPQDGKGKIKNIIYMVRFFTVCPCGPRTVKNWLLKTTAVHSIGSISHRAR